MNIKLKFVVVCLLASFIMVDYTEAFKKKLLAALAGAGLLAASKIPKFFPLPLPLPIPIPIEKTKHISVPHPVYIYKTKFVPIPHPIVIPHYDHGYGHGGGDYQNGMSYDSGDMYGSHEHGSQGAYQYGGVYGGSY